MNDGNKSIAVYAIKNIVTGQAYVGSTNSWRHRKASHLSMLRNNKHHSVWLQRAWNKYGEQSFIMMPCFNFTSHKEAIDFEGVVIDEYFLNGLYNCKPQAIGFVNCNQPKTESHKKSISAAIKQSWENEEIRERRSMSMRGKRDICKCPKCGLEGGGGNMKRYHFDNCKVGL